MTGNNKQDQRKPEFKAKGHDVVLQRAQDGKKNITVITNRGTAYAGVLVARDRYTVSVQQSPGNVSVIFKSAIESFTVAD